MTWLWLDLVTEMPTDALSAIPATRRADGTEAFLAFWPNDIDRPGRALRVDSRLASGGSPATEVSWCRAEGEVHFAFDDGAVSGALRRVLGGPWPGAVSTLLIDWSRIAGAISAATEREAIDADPFARVFPREWLRVAPGALGSIEAPTGPGITRYGSGNPWPSDRYAGQVS